MKAKPGAKSPHQAFYHYDGGMRLAAIRSGKWKLMFPQQYSTISEPGVGGIPGKGKRHSLPLSLFDLETDIGETTNLADQHPEVVKRLEKLADSMRTELGDGKQNVGQARRPLGQAK